MAVVSILTGLERPVQQFLNDRMMLNSLFQSSPALKDRCNGGCYPHLRDGS